MFGMQLLSLAVSHALCHHQSLLQSKTKQIDARIQHAYQRQRRIQDVLLSLYEPALITQMEQERVTLSQDIQHHHRSKQKIAQLLPELSFERECLVRDVSDISGLPV